MRATHNPPLLFGARPLQLADERRRHGRLRCDDLVCSLGDVLDLSGSGLRVGRRGRQIVRVGDEFPLRLAYGSEAVLIHARVARAEKVGFRRYEYGLEMLNVDDATRRTLTRFATMVSERRVLG